MTEPGHPGRPRRTTPQSPAAEGPLLRETSPEPWGSAAAATAAGTGAIVGAIRAATAVITAALLLFGGTAPQASERDPAGRSLPADAPRAPGASATAQRSAAGQTRGGDRISRPEREKDLSVRRTAEYRTPRNAPATAIERLIRRHASVAMRVWPSKVHA